jgi:hypothetical protein
MPFVGYQPTAIPLSADDLEDNFRNIVINGDMSIAQRSTSVASISSGNTYHTLDRFRVDINSLGTWTMSQSTDVPTGEGFATFFKNGLYYC